MAPPGRDAAPGAGRTGPAAVDPASPVPNPAAATMPATDATDLLEAARRSVVDYRERAPNWVKHEGVQLFMGYMDHLLEDRPPGFESKICTLMRCDNLEDALVRYSLITKSLEKATYGEKSPRTYDQMLLEKKILEARITGLQKIRDDLIEYSDGGLEGDFDSTHRERRLSRRHDVLSGQILGLQRDIVNLEGRILKMQGSGVTQEFPSDSTVSLKQIALLRKFESSGLIDFSALPNESTDPGEQIRHAENPSMYRYRNWPKERIDSYRAEENARMSAEVQARENAARTEQLKNAARSLVVEVRSGRAMGPSVRKVYSDAIFGNSTDEYANWIRYWENKLNGGETTAMKGQSYSSRVNASEARSLLGRIESGPTTFGDVSPYSRLTSYDINNLLAYVGSEKDAARAMTRVENELPVGSNANYDHRVRVAGLHRLIESASARAILDGDTKYLEQVKSFLRDPKVFAILAADLALTENNLNTLLDEGLNNIPGVGREATNLFSNLARRIQDIERRPPEQRNLSRSDVEFVDSYLTRLEKYNEVKFGADPSSSQAQLFNHQLTQLRQRLNVLLQAPDIRHLGEPNPAALAEPQPRPAVPAPPVTFITPIDPNNPDPIQNISGLTLDDMHRAFVTYKVLRQNFDPASNPDQFSALRKTFGSLTALQRENLVMIVRADLQDPKDKKLVAEFVDLINDPDNKNVAVYLLNETHRIAMLEKRNPNDPSLVDRRDRLNQFVSELPQSERQQVLALVDRALQADGHENSLKTSLLTMRETVARAGRSPNLSLAS